MKKKICLVAALSLLILFIIVLLIFIYNNKTKDDIVLLKAESYFNEFYVEKDKVFIECSIVLSNTGNQGASVKLLADMTEDADNGLLKEPKIYGYHKNGDDEFFVPANSKKEFSVLFIGAFAGKEEKINRNLPQIEVMEK